MTERNKIGNVEIEHNLNGEHLQAIMERLFREYIKLHIHSDTEGRRV